MSQTSFSCLIITFGQLKFNGHYADVVAGDVVVHLRRMLNWFFLDSEGWQMSLIKFSSPSFLLKLPASSRRFKSSTIFQHLLSVPQNQQFQPSWIERTTRIGMEPVFILFSLCENDARGKIYRLLRSILVDFGVSQWIGQRKRSKIGLKLNFNESLCFKVLRIFNFEILLMP